MRDPVNFTYLLGLLGFLGGIAGFWYLDSRDEYPPDDPTKSRLARAVRVGLRIGLPFVVIISLWVLAGLFLDELIYR